LEALAVGIKAGDGGQAEGKAGDEDEEQDNVQKGGGHPLEQAGFLYI